MNQDRFIKEKVMLEQSSFFSRISHQLARKGLIVDLSAPNYFGVRETYVQSESNGQTGRMPSFMKDDIMLSRPELNTSGRKTEVHATAVPVRRKPFMDERAHVASTPASKPESLVRDTQPVYRILPELTTKSDSYGVIGDDRLHRLISKLYGGGDIYIDVPPHHNYLSLYLGREAWDAGPVFRVMPTGSAFQRTEVQHVCLACNSKLNPLLRSKSVLGELKKIGISHLLLKGKDNKWSHLDVSKCE
jgi:hypothetical protein